MPNKSFFQGTSSEFSQQKSIQKLEQELVETKEHLTIAKETVQKVSKMIDKRANIISHTEKKHITIEKKLLSSQKDNESNSLRLEKEQCENSIARQKQKLEPLITRKGQLAINILQLETNAHALQTHLSRRKANAFNEAIAQAMQQQHPF